TPRLFQSTMNCEALFIKRNGPACLTEPLISVPQPIQHIAQLKQIAALAGRDNRIFKKRNSFPNSSHLDIGASQTSCQPTFHILVGASSSKPQRLLKELNGKRKLAQSGVCLPEIRKHHCLTSRVAAFARDR